MFPLIRSIRLRYQGIWNAEKHVAYTALFLEMLLRKNSIAEAFPRVILMGLGCSSSVTVRPTLDIFV